MQGRRNLINRLYTQNGLSHAPRTFTIRLSGPNTTRYETFIFGWTSPLNVLSGRMEYLEYCSPFSISSFLSDCESSKMARFSLSQGNGRLINPHNYLFILDAYFLPISFLRSMRELLAVRQRSGKKGSSNGPWIPVSPWRKRKHEGWWSGCMHVESGKRYLPDITGSASPDTEITFGTPRQTKIK